MKPPEPDRRAAAIAAAYARGLARSRARERPGFPADEPDVLSALEAVYASVPGVTAKEIVAALRWAERTRREVAALRSRRA